ncbi:MAG: hypothetical protein ABSE42_07375 [Bryobacteraceae bacterium]|jgi:hypothetical protein
MSDLPTSSLADAPQPWRLTHSRLRRAAIAGIRCDRDNVETVLRLLDRSLEVLSTTPEPSLPESLLTYWEFTAAWLAEAMPELPDIGERPVASLLEQKDLGAPVSAEALTRYFSWWVLADLGRSMLMWLRDAPVSCRSMIDSARFLKLAERRWRGLDPWLAGELFRTAVEISAAAARPLLEAVENESAVPEQVRDAARNYRGWIDLPS